MQWRLVTCQLGKTAIFNLAVFITIGPLRTYLGKCVIAYMQHATVFSFPSMVGERASARLIIINLHSAWNLGEYLPGLRKDVESYPDRHRVQTPHFRNSLTNSQNSKVEIIVLAFPLHLYAFKIYPLLGEGVAGSRSTHLFCINRLRGMPFLNSWSGCHKHGSCFAPERSTAGFSRGI